HSTAISRWGIQAKALHARVLDLKLYTPYILGGVKPLATLSSEQRRIRLVALFGRLDSLVVETGDHLTPPELVARGGVFLKVERAFDPVRTDEASQLFGDIG